MTVRRVPLGKVLRSAGEVVSVAADTTYEMLGVRSFARGAFAADSLLGASTAYKQLRRVKANQVVYPKLMAWEGAFAVVPAHLNGRFMSPEFQCFDADTSLASVPYIAHVLASPGFIESVRQGSAGTNVRRRRLQPSAFLRIPIPLPSLDRQDRIAAHLDAIERVSRSSTEEARLAAIHNGVIDAAARGVQAERLGRLLELQRRQVSVVAEAQYQEIGVRSFGRGLFIKDPVTGIDLRDKRVYRVEEGDLVVSNVFAWEGAVGLAGKEHDGMVGSHRFMTFTATTPSTKTAYLREYLRSSQGVAALAAASPGSAGRNRTLSISNFERIEVPVPRPESQERVANIGGRLDVLRARNARSSQLRAAVLPAARNEIFASMI